MHRTHRSSFIVGSALAATLSIAGIAGAEQPAPQASEKRSDTDTSAMRAEPTEVAIRGNGEQVKELQRELASRGFYQGVIDGIPGAKTRAALRNFQVQQGIAIEGGLNARTRDALGLEWSDERQPVSGTENPEKARTPDTTAPQKAGRERGSATAGVDSTSHLKLSLLTNDDVKVMQQRLHDQGFYQGPVDGVFGAGTKAALTRYFQRQAELAAQGMIDGSAVGAFGIEPASVKTR